MKKLLTTVCVLQICIFITQICTAQNSFSTALISDVAVTDSLCTDSLGNLTTIPPTLNFPSNFPTDNSGNFVYCLDTNFMMPSLSVSNSNLPNDGYILEYSNGSEMIVLENGTLSLDSLNLQLGDVISVSAFSYDLDAFNELLDLRIDLCPFVACPPIIYFLSSGMNDGNSGIDNLNEVILLLEGLTYSMPDFQIDFIESKSELIESLTGVNYAIAGLPTTSLCFGFSDLQHLIVADCALEPIITGCTDSLACNYNPIANSIFGCAYDNDSCDDLDPLTMNDVYTNFCNCEGTLIINGCTDSLACNYDPFANINFGCVYENSNCDDLDSLTIYDVYNAYCICEGIIPTVTGCTDSVACNYNPLANSNSGCAYENDSCDDLDSLTINDTYNSYCNCEGITTSINQYTKNATLSINTVYPIPALNNLIIEIETQKMGKYSLKVFNAIGQLQIENSLALTNSINSVNLNTRKLLKGIYFIELSNEEIKAYKKFYK